MARKKATKKRKKTHKKQAAGTRQTGRIYGALGVVAGGLALGKIGFLGTLCVNLLRLLGGDVYPVLALIMVIAGGFALIFNRMLPLTGRQISAGCLIICGWLMVVQAWQLHAATLGQTMNQIGHQLISNQVTRPAGGGLLGASLAQLTNFLITSGGTLVCGVILVVAGICWLFNLNVVAGCNWLAHHLTAYYRKYQLRRQAQKTAAAVENKEVTTASEDATSEPQVPPVQEPVAAPTKTEVTPPAAPAAATEEVSHQTWQETKEEKPSAPVAVDATPTVGADYQLPSPALLSAVAATDQSDEVKLIKRNEKTLQATLKSFGVDAQLVNTILGPAVTKYELHPAIGVKVSKIVNLSDDLALALAAKDIRIEAPIPGKSLIGIEVPNKKVATIAFKDVISQMKFDPRHPLTVPIGRDISGELITADLAKMPHLLIAGSTGSGKSVAINGIITSLLMNCHPDAVKLVLVDPKKVELGVYNDVPHLLTPVVTEAKKAAVALNKLVQEMERRYELFAKSGQRNITGYNAYAEKQNKQGNGVAKLPYIVMVIDELADLMMVASDDVEGSIVRLAQMARAAGIHMILATQRPSVNVITGLIKANIPSRMAFAVSSGVDSRTIIDTNGAEKLLGRGDMLFLPMGQSKPTRVQGAFIADSDVSAVVDFIKQQQTADYSDGLQLDDASLAADESSSSENADPLYEQVIDLARREQKISTSLIQRRFRIGYNRAARLVDQLYDQGLIGPKEGSKPRKVFLPPSDDSANDSTSPKTS